MEGGGRRGKNKKKMGKDIDWAWIGVDVLE